jgi:hypothetical protein
MLRSLNVKMLVGLLGAWLTIGCTSQRDGSAIDGDWLSCKDGASCHQLGDWGRRLASGVWIELSWQSGSYCLDDSEQGVFSINGNRITLQEQKSGGALGNPFIGEFSVDGDVLMLSEPGGLNPTFLQRAPSLAPAWCSPDRPPTIDGGASGG